MIKEIKENYQLILGKVNGTKLGFIDCEEINSISRGIEKISEISFTVSKYIGVEREINPLYNELKNERLIELNNEESFIIKNIKEKNESIKEITAYSREKNLSKINVDGIEDISLTLKTPYSDIDSCFSLDEILYHQTGWKIGYVSNNVLYDKEDSVMDIWNGVDGTLTTNEKLRYQESVSTNWYDFISNDIAEQFQCYPVFKSYEKVIDLYSEEEIGNGLQLMLTYDNYLKSLEKESSSDEICTRLILLGNEGIDIVGVNPTGDRFIEDYSYFIDNKEMSDELINAMKTYDEITKVRADEWYELIETKTIKRAEYDEINKELGYIYSKIRSLKIVIDKTTDEKYKAQLIEQLTELVDKKALLEPQALALDTEIRLLEEAILHINNLCKKENSTDNNGDLIFNQVLLDELKNFYFQETYSNDSFIEDKELLRFGLDKIKLMSQPTKTWSIDSENFKKKIISNEFNQQWVGNLSLGDLILLKGDIEEQLVFFVGYTQDYKSGQLTLELSNKKMNKDFSLTIGEVLTKANESYNKIMSNQYIFNRISKNRIGFNFDKINGEII